MGLFDTIYNSYQPLGDIFLNSPLQTKDLDCSMQDYWISPNGELFNINYNPAFDWRENPDFESSLINKEWTPPFLIEPNGKHGIISPVYHNGQVRVYPSNWNRNDYDNWTDRILLFKLGKIIEVLI